MAISLSFLSLFPVALLFVIDWNWKLFFDSWNGKKKLIEFRLTWAQVTSLVRFNDNLKAVSWCFYLIETLVIDLNPSIALEHLVSRIFHTQHLSSSSVFRYLKPGRG